MTSRCRNGKHLVRLAAAAAVLLALPGCGNDPNTTAGPAAIKGFFSNLTSGLGGKADTAAAAQPVDALAVVNAALQATDGPVMLVVMETAGNVALLGLSQRNGDYATWFGPDRRALSFKHGVLSGTRGLGDDLMAVKADAAIETIRARQSGQVLHSYYYLDGLGITQSLQLECAIAPGGQERLEIGEIAAQTTEVVETCRNGGFEVQNRYWVDATGQILKSRQWIGQTLGYAAIQLLRK